ncbi:hypothetical protein CDAR_239831 [Caerostris darwini]|uniref:Uncharacterized protein n=1 Tax=Caerostris darwini TaxID=1538125 RepID=A0AAV4R015_9ARAC|nr:hypothetical protein CDAR_239831 [Caerostris darwini]
MTLRYSYGGESSNDSSATHLKKVRYQGTLRRAPLLFHFGKHPTSRVQEVGVRTRPPKKKADTQIPQRDRTRICKQIPADSHCLSFRPRFGEPL